MRPPLSNPPGIRPLLTVVRVVRLHSPSLAFGLAVGLAACGGRTPLLVAEEIPPPAADDAGADGAVPDAAALEHVVDAAPPRPPPPPPADPCANMPPIPCPGGGSQYCVAGHYSECPKRCAVCVPGSTRICFIAYCKSWGVQTCTTDGLSFGYCQEGSPPSQCESVADESRQSPALEQCCIDSGNCCQDLFDLNGNGSTSDQVGNCSGTTCN